MEAIKNRLLSKNREILGLLVILLAVAIYFFLPESCPEPARRCAAIFIFAAGCWSLEIFPLYTTSLIVVGLLCLLLALPGGSLELGRNGYKIFLAPFASPIVMLFFGGFVIATAFNKYHADAFLASRALSLFQKRPEKLVIGIMLTTALLSMWISNTATTVIMLGILGPILKNPEIPGSVRKGLLLSIPFSANIGGVATPIGTPPNALAMGFLQEAGQPVNFVEWMVMCLPLMVLLLCVAWAVIHYFIFSVGTIEEGQIPKIESPTLCRQGKHTLIIALATIFVWLSTPFHKIPEPLTALLCAATLTGFGLIDRKDLKKIDWDVLILMWGGLALGVGIQKTGLGGWMIEHLFPQWKGPLLVVLFGSIALVFSLFISNTATAALIIPLAIKATDSDQPIFAVTTALMCSVAMIFPVSTPPNALAYGSGLIKNREMMKAGAVITLCCYLVILIGFWWIIPNVLYWIDF